MVQTPQQRKANLQFARANQNKMGKPQAQQQALKEKKEKASLKAPISPFWLYLLLFVVVGGLAFELLRIIFQSGSRLF